MRSFYVLADAVSYIEEHLESQIFQEEIAAHCFCSVSGLQKLFRYALEMSVKDYVDRRRLTQASRALLSEKARIMDIALRFQYQSPEVFGRAFRRMWGMTPTEFRRSWRFGNLFPRVEGIETGGDGMVKRKLDISELYDTLRDMRESYVLCFDIVGLMRINEISYEAGDQVIRECLRRLDAVATEGMLLVRTGSDEFAIATGLTNPLEVERLAAPIIAQNGQPIAYEGKDIPVAMRVGCIKLEAGNLRYAELFDAIWKSTGVPNMTYDKVYFM